MCGGEPEPERETEFRGRERASEEGEGGSEQQGREGEDKRMNHVHAPCVRCAISKKEKKKKNVCFRQSHPPPVQLAQQLICVAGEEGEELGSGGQVFLVIVNCLQMF